MEVIVKKFLAIIMLGLAANLFGMQQPTVEFPEDSIELKIQEFYTKYEFIDRTVRSINSAPAEQINQAIACIDDATKLLRTIESQLTNKCAESDEWYALAQALRVANLLPFKEIIPSCAIMVLKSQISARMFDLNTDISRCRGILEVYRADDIPAMHTTAEQQEQHAQHDVPVNLSRVVVARSPISNIMLAGISAGAGAVTALCGYTVYALLHRGGRLPVVAASPQTIAISMPKTFTSKINSENIISSVAFALASGLWAASRATAEIARDSFDMESFLSWLQMFLGQ